MVGGFEDAVKIPELRKRVLFTLSMLIVYRIGVFVPTPGINSEAFSRLFDQASGTLFGLANMFSGGALERFSVFALGIMPYISVSIIIQLMQSSIPHLENLSKEGEQGRRVITRYTRIGTIILSLLQGMMISIGLESQGVVSAPGWHFRIVSMITLAAGTSFIMWLGEQISERGIGNGISLIITAGILAKMPSVMLGTFSLTQTGELDHFKMLLLMVFGALTVLFIVFVERSQRRIPVQYPKRAMGRRMVQATTQHLPFKLNTAGVIPPIFATSVMIVPATIANFSSNESLQHVTSMLLRGTFWGDVVFSILIIFFCFFYTALVLDPEKVAENLKKQGGFIPTRRPGKETAEFINDVLTRLTFWGSIYVVIICLVPDMVYRRLGAGSFSYFFGGTAVLIVVGVVLDTAAQLESHVVARNYEGFMNKSPGKIRGQSRATAVRGRLIQR